MPTVYVDDKPYEVPENTNMLEACLGLGFDLPYFCWHPAMGSVGACRQCAVVQYKDADDDQGQVVMSCMTAAEDGTRISIEAPTAEHFRRSVIEWLMSNHPHDCPVCEEGGECHLQDMTVMTGHAYRRFRFNKRTHRNQDLGPFIEHEMNRCIACYRCVRFYREYAGGEDLNAFGSHHHVYFGRETDGALENEFSGNLVEICPTGVFTDKTLSKRYSRKWDLQTAPSICTHCSLGCNTSPGERYGTLKRIQNRYNGAVNGYFICDRGRFGYDFVNSDRRLTEPKLPAIADDPENSDPLQGAVRRALGENGRMIGIGSPRASVEANFALRRLVGAENFHSGASATDDELARLSLEILRNGPARVPTLTETEHADVVLVLGEDLTHTAPRLALNLRQTVRRAAFQEAGKIGVPSWQDHSVRQVAPHARSPLFIAAPTPTKLDDAAYETAVAPPTDIARLGYAIAHRLDPSAPEPDDLAPELAAFADHVADNLRNAKRPLIVSGYGCQEPEVLRAAANTAWALCGDDRDTGLFLTQPEANSLGLAMMEPRPLAEALDAEPELAVVLENDLFRRADTGAVDRFLDRAGATVAVDSIKTPTTDRADVALPAGSFAEADGTLISAEGRAQRFFQVMPSPGEIRESWRWMAVLDALADGRDQPRWNRLDEVIADCADEIPALAAIVEAAPDADFRVAGMRLARAPHRYSGRTSMHADKTMHEPTPPEDPDSPFAFSMEGYHGNREHGQIPYFWAPSWNSIQSVNKFQDEIGGPLRGGDPGVRLIEPGSGEKRYFRDPPTAFEADAHHPRAFPVHQIFGSEELSALAPDLARRIPEPFLIIHPADGETLKSEGRRPRGGLRRSPAGPPGRPVQRHAHPRFRRGVHRLCRNRRHAHQRPGHHRAG